MCYSGAGKAHVLSSDSVNILFTLLGVLIVC